jgi:hypothetical protein
MTSIFPDSASAGALVIRDVDGNPTNPAGVHNAHVPAKEFVITCPPTALPSDCTARIEPRQINAIVSELLAFAECLDADGPWDCNSLTNLCAAFTAWSAVIDSLQSQIDALSKESQYVGSFDGSTGVITWVPEVGMSGGLPPPSTTNTGWILICTVAGTDPPGFPAGTYNVGDWVLSTGTSWNHLDFGGLTSATAGQIVVTPTILGGNDVQEVLGLLAAADVTLQTNINNKVSKSGDTMTGHLSLPTGPAAANAVRKDYVDAADAALQASKAPLASPVFTGNPSGPTPAPGDNDTSLATTAFTQAAIDAKAVRYDAAQALAIAQQEQARKNVYAAPFDALAYLGLQINGAMQVSQQFGTVGQAIPGGANTIMYVLDQWAIHVNAALTGRVSAYQQTGAFPGFVKHQGIYVTTTQAVIGAPDICLLRQSIEGWRWARLMWGTANAQPITLAFWTAHTPAGTYSVSIVNPNTGRSYVASYVQATAGVAQYNVITIPGDTSADTWSSENTIGAQIFFAMATGSGVITPTPNTWVAGQYFGVATQVNFLSGGGNAFIISGLTIHPGNEAPNAARSSFIQRYFQDELHLCRRYWQKIGGEAGGDLTQWGYAAAANGHIMQTIPITPAMRVVPTVTQVGNWTNQNVQGTFLTPSTTSFVWDLYSTAIGTIYSISGTAPAGAFNLNARM